MRIGRKIKAIYYLWQSYYMYVPIQIAQFILICGKWVREIVDMNSNFHVGKIVQLRLA